MHLNINTEPKTRQKFSRLGTWYIFALSAIAAISILGQVLIQRHLADQNGDSQVVNLAGRQRMLSQQISKLVLQLNEVKTADQRNETKNQLADATRLWDLTQLGLQEGNDSLQLSGKSSVRIRELFSQIESPFKKMVSGATTIVQALDQSPLASASALEPFVQLVLDHESEFLRGMDLIVMQYAVEANEKINSLRRMEYFLLAISLIVITAEVVFIFRPTAVQVTRTVKKLRSSEKNSKKLLKEIGALYASLEKSYEQLSVINQPIENPRLYAKADLGGNITFVSDTYTDVVGLKPSLQSQRLSDLFPGMPQPDDWMDEIIDTVTEGNSWQGEIRLFDVQGEECWLSIIIQPVNTDGSEELVLMGANMTNRKRAEQTMNRKNRAEIEKLVNQQKFRSVLILEGQEEERKRIAMDIHDGIGQMLTSLKFQIESIDPADPNVKKKINEVDQLIKNVIKEVRRVTFNLKPTVLGDYGLQAALNVFIQEIAKLTDIKLDYRPIGDIERLPQKIENNIFRIIQEAINNAIKYSEAPRIEILLERTGHDLVIVVRDEGKGFDTRLVEARSVNIESGRGFFNMYERTEYVNGRLDIESVRGNGTTVTLTVPISQKKNSKAETLANSTLAGTQD